MGTQGKAKAVVLTRIMSRPAVRHGRPRSGLLFFWYHNPPQVGWDFAGGACQVNQWVELKLCQIA